MFRPRRTETTTEATLGTHVWIFLAGDTQNKNRLVYNNEEIHKGSISHAIFELRRLRPQQVAARWSIQPRPGFPRPLAIANNSHRDSTILWLARPVDQLQVAN